MFFFEHQLKGEAILVAAACEHFAALLQLSNMLLCGAQQDINIQLDKNGNAG
jgi:hypothetical protein